MCSFSGACPCLTNIFTKLYNKILWKQVSVLLYVLFEACVSRRSMLQRTKILISLANDLCCCQLVVTTWNIPAALLLVLLHYISPTVKWGRNERNIRYSRTVHFMVILGNQFTLKYGLFVCFSKKAWWLF